jgi:hypothetical protein
MTVLMKCNGTSIDDNKVGEILKSLGFCCGKTSQP